MSAEGIDEDFRRLRARGTFTITPRSWDDSPVHLRWWPRGQHGNPFCSRAFLGATLGEVLRKAVRDTRPDEHSLDDLVSWRAWERAERERAGLAG